VSGCFEAGALIEVRGQQWLLTRAQRFDACTVLSLEGRDRANAMERMQIVDPYDRPHLVAPGSLERRRRQVVIKHALAAIHSAKPVDGLWTAAAARIDLHSYQLEPALAAIGGATRLLLADAVGLGKTIQAGLLLSELHQRGWIERALIVCPAGLRDTWQRELRERFAITAAILDQQSIADRVAAFPPGVNPWTADRIAIVSIDFVKRDEVIAALDGVPIDLLIADEAHHLSPGTDRGAAIARLASRSPWCVFISATPHSGDRSAFEYLTDLGRQTEDIVIFKRSRGDVGLMQARRVHFLKVHPHHDERALFDAIERYSRAIWCGRGQLDHTARLVAITLARRACSSKNAIERTLRRRLDLLGTLPAEAAQPRLPWEDVDDADGDDADAVLSARGLDNLDEERAALEQLIALAERCGSSSKMQRLMRLLSRINEPAIVFTEYRDTLDTFVQSLRDSYRVASIHGAMPPDSRTVEIERFNNGGVDVLAATDAAGEGLNLHQRCRLVVDYELPWNPRRLEQRVGRVDRLGQQRVVHAIRFFHGGTIEQDVLDRLAVRRRQAESDLDRAVSERDVAAAVFTGNNVVGPDVPAIRGMTIPLATSEIDRLRHQRRFRQDTISPARCWARPRHAGTRRLVVLHRQTFSNRDGVVVGNRVNAHTITLNITPRCLREWRVAIDGATTKLARIALNVPIENRIAIAKRIKAIRMELARAQRREYQRSLFDGRADAMQAERERVAARLDAALDRIQRSIASPDSSRTQIEIVAAWPDRRT